MNTTLGVEVFGPTGGASLNDADATSVVVAPGGTVLFGTGTANGLAVDSNLALNIVTKGSARVVATRSRGVLCSAFLADVFGGSPVSMTSLPVVKKTTQQGD